MKVAEAVEIVRFNISTQHDLTGRAANLIISNRNLVQQLMIALNKYAKHTKGIEGIYSTPIVTSTNEFPMPPLCLRGETFRAVWVTIEGRRYPVIGTNWNNVAGNFPYQVSGVPRYYVPWNNTLNFFPTSQTTFAITQLTADIAKTSTTIPVVSTASFPQYAGRFSIGTEKIYYVKKTLTEFQECIRGEEGTIAQAHFVNEEVHENNLRIYYYKLHDVIRISGNDAIDETVSCRELEVRDDHVEMILDYASYKLLLKFDINRAANFKVNFDEWLDRAKFEIRKGRDATKKTGDIRDPYYFEKEYVNPYL